MIIALALSLVLVQDPAGKTVEDRLKELADKVEALDKKAAALKLENTSLQLQLQQVQQSRETFARQSATAWVKRYAAAVEFTEKQSSELEELWYGWSKQDFAKPCDAAGWKAREETLRGKLTADQVPKFSRKVREDQDLSSRNWIASLGQLAKLPAEKIDAMEKAVLPKVRFEEGPLLPQASPVQNPWAKMTDALEASLPELALTESEMESLRKIIGRWKPKQR